MPDTGHVLVPHGFIFLEDGAPCRAVKKKSDGSHFVLVLNAPFQQAKEISAVLGREKETEASASKEKALLP